MAKGKKGTGDPRNSFKEVPCIIALDQSYTRTGIAIATNGKVRKALSVDLKNVKYKTEKRKKLAKVFQNCIDVCLRKYDSSEICVIVERIRTFSGIDSHMSPDFIKSQAALIATIVDIAFENGIKTYSVDTRCWKKAVLGTCSPAVEEFKGVKDPRKINDVKKAIELGFEEQLRVTNGKNTFKSYNDDMADAICISLYPFCPPPHQLLLEQ